MIGLGFFVTNVLLPSEAIADADAWLPRWLEDQRTPFLNDASYVASTIADRPGPDPARRGRSCSRSSCGSAGGWAASSSRPSSPRCSRTGWSTRFVERQSPRARRAARQVQPASQLPVGARGGFRRHLRLARRCCSPRTSRTFGRASRSGRSRRIPARRRRFSRLPRRAPSHRRRIAGALMGVGAICVALFAARTARRVAELRHEKHVAQRASRLRPPRVRRGPA